MTRIDGTGGADVHPRLAAIVPHTLSRGGFQIVLDESDPRLAAVLATLQEHGWRERRPGDRVGPRDRIFSRRSWREYDIGDFDRCRLVSMHGSHSEVFAGNRDEARRVLFEVRKAGCPEHLDAIRAGITCLLVPDRVRRVIESAGLRQIEFHEVVLVDCRDWPEVAAPWSTFGPPWWEMRGVPILPPVAASMTILDFNLNRMSRTSGDAVMIILDPDDARIRPPELRYAGRELPPLELFDAARTFERAGSAEDRWFVASQRFRQAWLEEGLHAEWVPVWIEDGDGDGIQ